MDNINFKKVLDDGELFDQQANYEENFEKINQEVVPKITALESGKVDKVAGKGLSTNDFDNTYKQKIDVDIPAQLNDKADKAQGSWITPTLLNAWVELNGYPVRYRKDQFGKVHLKGRIRGGSLGSEAFIMPSGYRPLQSLYFTPTNGSTTPTRGYVASSGSLVIDKIYTDFIDISQVSFFID